MFKNKRNLSGQSEALMNLKSHRAYRNLKKKILYFVGVIKCMSCDCKWSFYDVKRFKKLKAFLGHTFPLKTQTEHQSTDIIGVEKTKKISLSLTSTGFLDYYQRNRILATLKANFKLSWANSLTRDYKSNWTFARTEHR